MQDVQGGSRVDSDVDLKVYLPVCHPDRFNLSRIIIKNNSVSATSQ